MATHKRKAASRGAKARTRKAKPARPARRAAPRKTAGTRPPERRRHDPETLRLRSVTPSFTVNDLQRSLAFYTDMLGFIVGERWTDGDKLRGVMLKAGVCEIGLSQDDWAKGRDRKKGEAVRIWCQTSQDVDALAARVKAAGFALTEAPHSPSWGGRSFSVDDPDGFHLTISRES